MLFKTVVWKIYKLKKLNKKPKIRIVSHKSSQFEVYIDIFLNKEVVILIVYIDSLFARKF